MDPNEKFHYGHMSRYIDSVHDDVIKWKHFPRYWPFVLTRSFDVFFDLRLDERL